MPWFHLLHNPQKRHYHSLLPRPLQFYLNLTPLLSSTTAFFVNTFYPSIHPNRQSSIIRVQDPWFFQRNCIRIILHNGLRSFPVTDRRRSVTAYPPDRRKRPSWVDSYDVCHVLHICPYTTEYSVLRWNHGFLISYHIIPYHHIGMTGDFHGSYMRLRF